MAVHFDPDKHLYYINDVQVPSVTQMLRAMKIAPEYRGTEDYALKGTRIHEGTVYVERGTWDPHTTTPELVPYLEAWREFIRSRHVSVLGSEIIVSSERLLLAGTVDKLAKVDGKLTVIEIKTGQEHPWHRLQCGCYWNMAEQEYGPIPSSMVVYLSPSGIYRIATVTIEDKEASLCTMKLYHYLRTMIW